MQVSNGRRGSRRRGSAGALVALAIALAFVIAACGGSDDSKTTANTPASTSGGSNTVSNTTADDTTQDVAAPAFTPDQQAGLPGDNWFVNGGSLLNQRYSPLDEITTENVSQLRGLWHTHLNNSGVASKYSAEGQPLYYNGVIYETTGADDAFAVDAASGRILWQYKANLDPAIASVVCCGFDNRGLGMGDGMLFDGKLDGHVVALDMRTGTPVWDSNISSTRNGYTITMPPLYYDGMIFVSSVGAEYGTRGFMEALDARTGRMIWKHYNIPSPSEPGGDSWPAGTDQYKHGGGGVWSQPAIDPRLGMIYYSTANAGSDWDGRERSGDNKWSSSMLALDVRTGRFKWGYQQVHHDIWDMDSPSPVVLMDATVNGRDVQGISQPSKTGYVYFLDRTSGRPIFPIPERKVPTNPDQPNASPTQPIPSMAPFSATRIAPAELAKVQAAVRTATPKGQPVPRVISVPQFTPFEVTGKSTILASAPGPAGGNNWEPSSYNPDTHMYYVCAQDNAFAVAIPKRTVAYKTGENTSGVAMAGSNGFNAPGTLTAYNMDTGRIAWQDKWPDACYSGAVSTGGNLVFVGRNRGQLEAYDGRTGDRVWSFQTGAGSNAPVVVYQRDGHEYITQLAGGNALNGSPHGDNLWTWGLDGTLGPAAAPGSGRAIVHAGEGGDARGGDRAAAGGAVRGDAMAGSSVFADNCAVCHGARGTGGNGGPDLTTIPAAKTIAGVTRQVTNGGGGMPAFGGQLSSRQIADVAAFVTSTITR
ncbi:MAG TPA: PQQ-binding-like beta-propeller repeat protein [Conexibacter sp.]|jgi:alcohol dehydrogenase (cytochrome c)